MKIQPDKSHAFWQAHVDIVGKGLGRFRPESRVCAHALIAMGSLLATTVRGAEPELVLPAMNFVSSVARDDLFGVIKANGAFAKLDKELIGSPIILRISHSLQPTATGKATGLLSAIWSGSTLGLLPVVTNNSFVLTYEVRVQGKDVATYSYQRNFTRAVNIWAKDDATHGLGAEGLEWARSTAAEFAVEAARDARLPRMSRDPTHPASQRR